MGNRGNQSSFPILLVPYPICWGVGEGGGGGRYVTILKHFVWRISHRKFINPVQNPPNNGKQKEALGGRRPPWPRQIITPIFPNVIMLSLGGERIITCTVIWVCYHYYGGFLFCSFTHLRIPRPPPKLNQFFIVGLPKTPP